MHVGVCAYMREPGDQPGWHSSGLIHLPFLKARVSHRLRTHQAGHAGWSATPSHSRVSLSPALGVQAGVTTPSFFTYVLGIELSQVLGLSRQHFTDWPIA